MTRFGMDVVLAHPEGYEVMPEVEDDRPQPTLRSSGGIVHTRPTPWRRPSEDADIVYPKSWAPFAAMEERTEALCRRATRTASTRWSSELLAQNAEHKDWACTEEMMKLTKDGKALYLHCLPADITGLSCEEGEVDNSVFDRYLRAPV